MTFPRPRSGVARIAPYVGGKAELKGVAEPIKLSSNENPFGPSPKAIAALARAAASAHLYPDGAASDLRRAIGARFGVDGARIRVGAGCDELIALLCRAYAGEGDEVLFPEHGFLMYELSALAAGAEPVTAPEKDRAIDIDALIAAATPRTRLVFVTNPGNPTGAVLSAAQLVELRRRLRDDILLAIDGAYAEYADSPAFGDGLALARDCENVVVLRTFSKMFGLAGLRLGWLYAAPAICDVIDRVRGPFNTSSAAQAAAIAALEDEEHQARSIAHNARWRATLTDGLRDAGYRVEDSQANFVLIDFGSDERARAAERYLEAEGLILRAMGSYGLPSCLRATIGAEAANEKLLEALKRFAENKDADAA